MRIAMMIIFLFSLSPAYAKRHAKSSPKKAHARVKVDKHKTQAKADTKAPAGSRNSLDGLPGF
jgi:hypothetical protein